MKQDTLILHDQSRVSFSALSIEPLNEAAGEGSVDDAIRPFSALSIEPLNEAAATLRRVRRRRLFQCSLY